ncbi:MAG: hypothetical protein GY920_11225, partial [Aliivibrio sp.]|nr:hypothetical protein [Aliivibrio sp.]
VLANGNVAVLQGDDSTVNPRQFGAKGDNSNDDQEYIQASIDYMRDNGGGIVQLSEGGYKIESPLKMYNSVYLIGQGTNTYPHNIDGTYIQKAFNGDAITFTGSGQTVFEDGWGVKNLNIFCDGNNFTGRGIYVFEASGFVLDNVLVTRAKSHPIHIQDSGFHQILHCRPIECFGAVGTYNIYEQGTGDWHIDNCDFGNTPIYRNAVTGIRAENTTGRVSNCKIFFCRIGIDIALSTVQVTSNTLNDNFLGGVRNNGFESIINNNLVYNIEPVNVPDSNYIAFEDLAGRSCFVGNVVKYTPGSLLYAFQLNNVSKSIVTGNICVGADGANVCNEVGGRKNTIVGNNFGAGVSSNITARDDTTNTVQDSIRHTAYSNNTTSNGFGIGMRYSAVFGADGSSPVDLLYIDAEFLSSNTSKVTFSSITGSKKEMMNFQIDKVSFAKGIRLGDVPSTQNSGDIWYDVTGGKLMARISGVDREIQLV